MMHFGTNDVLSAIPPAQILDAYTSIGEGLRGLNSDAVILVAQIIPLHPDASFGCADFPQRAIDFNAEIPGWAAQLSTAQSPIVVVDQHTGFDPATETHDSVHPDEEGCVKIAAEAVFDLELLLGQVQPFDHRRSLGRSEVLHALLVHAPGDEFVSRRLGLVRRCVPARWFGQPVMMACSATGVGDLLDLPAPWSAPPRLRPNARLVNLTMPTRPIASLNRSENHAFVASRCALDALTKMIAVEVTGAGPIVAALWPGYLRTDMNGHAG